MREAGKIGVFGAGSIGMYVGGRLLAAGNGVGFVGRQAMARDVAGGVVLTRFGAGEQRIEPGRIRFSSVAKILGDCAVVLVCVKSADTAAAGKALSAVLAPGACVVSLQNGVANAAVLRSALPDHPVLAGMVGFNVARIGADRFHQGTQGELILQSGECADELAGRLVAAGLPVRVVAEIDSVLWGKLVLNLNNAVNAISGLPLKAQLSQRRHRLLLADCMAEGLAVLKAAGIAPARIAKVPPQWLPAILRLPDFLFIRIAGAMLRIDDTARSSMAEDLERGREPEIDYLNGEIVRLGQKVGVATPVNEAAIAEVKGLFEKAKRQ